MRSALGVLMVCAAAAAQDFHSVTVELGKDASARERRCAEVFADRVKRLSDVPITIGTEPGGPDSLTVRLGNIAADAQLAELLKRNKLPLPTQKDPGKEGFLLHADQNPSSVIAAGVDEPGVLYAVGELLRRLDYLEHSVSLAGPLRVWTAPAFEIRGIMVSQGRTITDLAHAREWTEDDWEQAVLDYVLAGANTISVGYSMKESEQQYEFIKGLGIKTLVSWYPNAGNSNPAWEAVEAIGRPGYYCLSIPEAREEILKKFDAAMAAMAHMDYVRFYSGDGGGCECDRCAPFGAKYIALCREMADIVHKHHPNAQIFATNQKLDNAGDEAIFAYLREHPGWLRGLSYGPGSNAMGWAPGRRQDHRMDLFEYPAFGSMDRYLREIVHQLPPKVDLLFYTDITHWVYSQYGLMDHQLIPDRNHDLPPLNERSLYALRPDPYLAQVYNRRTFHARPRAYYRVFQQTERYGIGDAVYSEGHHDHFNQWMWMRLLWRPHSLDGEQADWYAREFFGIEVANDMRDAIEQMEDNLSEPLLTNPGIDGQIVRLDRVWQRMPEFRKRKDYLWRQYMQRALIDKYIQLRVARQTAVYDRAVATIRNGLDGDVVATLEKCAKIFGEPVESEEMVSLREKADRLGRESDTIYGVRNEGLFNLDQDFVGLGWLQKQFAAACALSGQEQRAALRRIAYYEDPGEGGFYDDAGDPERSPHLVYGWPYGDGEFSGANRPSQRTAAFTTDERQGVAFEYDGLDPNAQYRARFTLVRPRYLPRFGKFQLQKSETIYADDIALVKDLELPEYESQFFEYDVPREATKDGHLKLWFEKSAGVGEGPRPEVTVWRNTGGWGTLVSEVWLMKK